jgi:hypothetical protein
MVFPVRQGYEGVRGQLMEWWVETWGGGEGGQGLLLGRG